MERDLPGPNASIRACTSELVLSDPEHRADTSGRSIPDANGVSWLGHTVDEDVGIE